MDYLERLNAAITDLQNNADRLAQISELISLLAELTNEVREEKQQLSENQKQIDGLLSEIKLETEAVTKLTENSSKQFEEIITIVKEELIKTKKENIEAIDSISTTLGNKISLLDSNINTKIDLRSSELNQTFQKSLQENNDKISEQFLKTNDSINQINTDVKNNNKIIKIIGGISALGVVLGVIICVLLFTKLG